MLNRLRKPDWLTLNRIIIGVIIILLAIALDPSLSFTKLMNWLGAVGFVASLLLLIFNKSASTKLLTALIISMSMIVYTTGIISWRNSPVSTGIAYQVAAQEDVAPEESKRFVLHVVVSEPATVEELQWVAKQVVADFREENFGALRLQFYDYADYIGLDFPLGYAVYAPDGLWNQAGTVAAGQTAPMSFAWHLEEKDWSLRLNSREAQAVATWHQLATIYKYANDLHMDETELSGEVAAAIGLDIDEVEAALSQFRRWTGFID